MHRQGARPDVRRCLVSSMACQAISPGWRAPYADDSDRYSPTRAGPACRLQGIAACLGQGVQHPLIGLRLPYARIPVSVRSSSDQVPVEVCRTVAPPHRAALAQCNLGRVHCAASLTQPFRIVGATRSFDRPARMHQIGYQLRANPGRKAGIGRAPKSAANHEVTTVGSGGMHQADLPSKLRLVTRQSSRQPDGPKQYKTEGNPRGRRLESTRFFSSNE